MFQGIYIEFETELITLGSEEIQEVRANKYLLARKYIMSTL